MPWMFELYYDSPRDVAREERTVAEVARFGGWLDYHELPDVHSHAICLTFEFRNANSAEAAAMRMRELGEHVEGPLEYGDD